MTTNSVKLRRWHRVRHSWWKANDSWQAKVVTGCGIRRNDETVASGSADSFMGSDGLPDPTIPLCSRCYPDGVVQVIRIKSASMLRAFSEAQP
jgi:hypothetical protein